MTATSEDAVSNAPPIQAEALKLHDSNDPDALLQRRVRSIASAATAPADSLYNYADSCGGRAECALCTAMASRRQPVEATVSLVQLRNCLVNLPPSLTGPLLNTNTPPQNVVVELQHRLPKHKATGASSSAQLQSVFLGWTGLSSKPRSSLTSRQSSQDAQYASSSGPMQDATVEIDAAFARTLGLEDGVKAQLLPYLDPALAHTVHIEPLTPADWDIIELHATFLEMNLQTQIRALPNPAFVAAPLQGKGKSEEQTQTAHPLTIHLSPTSTANIIVTQLTPPVPKDVAFAKLSPDAEVIVAPKTRPKVAGRGGKNDSRSVMSGSARSARTSGTARQRSHRSEVKKPIFLRAVDQSLCPGLSEGEGDGGDDGGDDGDDRPTRLQLWVDSQLLASTKNLRGAEHVLVSIVRPAGLQPPMDAQQLQRYKELEAGEAGLGASRIVARVHSWNESPNQQCAVLSTQLGEALGVKGVAGSIIRLEPAPPPLPAVKSIKVYPFASTTAKQTEGLKFGGETRASRESAAQRLKTFFGRRGECNIFNGPLTDGLVLPQTVQTAEAMGWNGGIVRIDKAAPATEMEKGPATWTLVREEDFQIEVQGEVPSPLEARNGSGVGDELIPASVTSLVGLDDAMAILVDNCRHTSSTLLNGGLGSGKSLVVHHLARHLSREHLYHVAYFPCRKLVTDETRVSAIKDTFSRLFMQAAWGARLGGRSLVILDDLDRLCPAEQELQVGDDNARSRQIGELLCSIVKQHCGAKSGVLLVATAQGKESLHDTVVGGHILPESVDLKAPNKDKRRRILESLAEGEQEGDPRPKPTVTTNGTSGSDSWMDDSSSSNSRPTSSYHQEPQSTESLDFLDIAGQTDGYMPGDLHLLFSRAKSEALIRTISDSSSAHAFRLTKQDFDRALDGFTPASLRNVTLQTSSTTFSSIGGLHETRKILLETLQYPTTYAPIFAQCPLRLRSGLLLYGYPGCGKTLLASAVAGECGLNFISVKGPEILNKYIGASEKSVRDLFERAEAARPCVLFFDEFDSIAPKRGHDSTGVTDRVVNQLLTQMDGAEGLTGVYVLAATSRPDMIDPALLRPGRLDKSLLCDMPSEFDRLDILRALSTQLKMHHGVAEGAPHSPYSLHEVARRTEGYSGADLQAVVYNAHLEAIHDILDDQAPKSPESSKAPRSSSRRLSISSGAQGHHHDLIHFRYGLEEDRKAAAALTGPKAASERMILMAKLDAQRQARRKEREARRGVSMSASQHLMNGTDTKESKDVDAEVVIAWQHIEKSLATTRSSISARERLKLQAIYNEFVQGRNGEMPSGQGPTEIGARSSLM